MSDSTRTPYGATLSVDPAWGRTARTWGIFAGIAFATATAAFVVEATGLLASSPAYTPTAAGQLVDEAKFFAASPLTGARPGASTQLTCGPSCHRGQPPATVQALGSSQR